MATGRRGETIELLERMAAENAVIQFDVCIRKHFFVLGGERLDVVADAAVAMALKAGFIQRVVSSWEPEYAITDKGRKEL